MAIQWETINNMSISDTTQRLAVPGGWLVCRISGIHFPKSLTSWFVDDVDHTWAIE